MFDANMRHLPKGHKFFALVWGTKQNTILAKHGVNRDDMCLCTMLDDDVDNPQVTFHLPSGDVDVYSSSEGMFAYHILYVGTLKGDELVDFAKEEDYNQAKLLMENK